MPTPASGSDLWLAERLSKPEADVRRVVAEVIRKPELVVALLEGPESRFARVRFGSSKALRLLSEQRPELLYPYFRVVVAQLDNPNNILRWNAIYMLGQLAAADRKGKIDRLVDRYLEPIAGPQLIAAATTIAGAAAIAAAKPHLAGRIEAAILNVGRARYQTEECRNVAMGHAISALDRIFQLLPDREAALRFGREQTENPRPATRRKAERFLKKWSDRGPVSA